MDKRKAFQSQSSECILVGYAEYEKSYKLMELATRKCSIEHSVQFEEDQLFDIPPFEAQEGITNLLLPFDDDILSHVSHSDEDDQDQRDIGIEAEPHEILDPYPTPTPNQCPRPKWAQKLIVVAWDCARNLEDRRRTRSQY